MIKVKNIMNTNKTDALPTVISLKYVVKKNQDAAIDCQLERINKSLERINFLFLDLKNKVHKINSLSVVS